VSRNVSSLVCGGTGAVYTETRVVVVMVVLVYTGEEGVGVNERRKEEELERSL
jgi:hypothetical protein